MAFDQKSYVNEYIKEKIKYRRMNFNVQRPDDMAMIAWLDSQQEGISNYLKRLVLEDMKKHSPG